MPKAFAFLRTAFSNFTKSILVNEQRHKIWHYFSNFWGIEFSRAAYHQLVKYKIMQKFAISSTAQLSLFGHLSVLIIRTPECPYYEDTWVSLIWGHLSVLILRTSSSDEWHLDVLKMGTLRCPYNEDVLIIKTPKCPHFKDVQPDDFTHYVAKYFGRLWM